MCSKLVCKSMKEPGSDILIYISINFDVVSKYFDGKLEVESMMSEISLKKRLNNRGPFTLPCGVPLLIVHGYESA